MQRQIKDKVLFLCISEFSMPKFDPRMSVNLKKWGKCAALYKPANFAETDDYRRMWKHQRG